MTKWCTFCGREKPLEAFPLQAHGRFGRTAWCRVCRNFKQRRRRQKRYKVNRAYREAVKAANRAKYARRSEVFCARQWVRDERKRQRRLGLAA